MSPYDFKLLKQSFSQLTRIIAFLFNESVKYFLVGSGISQCDAERSERNSDSQPSTVNNAHLQADQRLVFLALPRTVVRYWKYKLSRHCSLYTSTTLHCPRLTFVLALLKWKRYTNVRIPVQ